MVENSSKAIMDQTIFHSKSMILKIIDAFRSDWTSNPPSSVRKVLGYWTVTQFRHLRAINTLVQEHDLYMVSEIHYRQMLEIAFQIRFILLKNNDEMEYYSKKALAMACIDFLDQMKPFKDMDLAGNGYNEQEKLLESYDKQIVNEIKNEPKKKSRNWFGMSFSSLARLVSRDNEDLKSAYSFSSAFLHNIWGLTIDISNPEPGIIDFRGYPDMDTVYGWGAELVDRATQLYFNTWNDIARKVGAKEVSLL